jgi:hypothetical protein
MGNRPAGGPGDGLAQVNTDLVAYNTSLVIDSHFRSPDCEILCLQ